LWLAGEALDDPGPRDLAVEAMHAVFRRPVPERRIESPTFCHGVAGLLQVVVRFAHDTGLADFRDAAAELVDELLAAYEPGLRRINPAFSRAWVRERWRFSEPAAQPVVTVGYRERIPPLRTRVPGLVLANTTQIFPEDRGTNYSVRLGREVAAKIAASAGRAQIVRGAHDRVVGIVDVPTEPVRSPARRHELHRPLRPRRACAPKLPERRLDEVDGREHVPRHPESALGLTVEREQPSSRRGISDLDRARLQRRRDPHEFAMRDHDVANEPLERRRHERDRPSRQAPVSRKQTQ
jgi:hypothetical protein